MTIDSHTDTVFFSDRLPDRCPELYKSIIAVLDESNIEHRLLQNTKDIWCRDYMPIQANGKRFVFYKYYPDYLNTPYYRRTITDVSAIPYIDSLRNEETCNLDLILDGGNVVKCLDKVIMTEKVFFENKDKSRKAIRQMLEEAFQCDIVFLPWDKNEIFGHSDGIVHYIGDNRVLMTNYADFDANMAKVYIKAMENYVEVIPLSYKVKRKHARSWAYINYLKVGGLVIVPQLGIPEDEQALQQIAEVMPKSKVVGVPALEAVRNGGALNCISWNVQTIDWSNGFMGEEYRVQGHTIGWVLNEAAKGNAMWQNDLGCCYSFGRGVKQDMAEANAWFAKAAEQGYDTAQFNIGLSYFKGAGLPHDLSQARRWFEKAAAQGSKEAQLHIAWCLEDMQAPQEEVVERVDVRLAEVLRRKRLVGVPPPDVVGHLQCKRGREMVYESCFKE